MPVCAGHVNPACSKGIPFVECETQQQKENFHLKAMLSHGCMQPVLLLSTPTTLFVRHNALEQSRFVRLHPDWGEGFAVTHTIIAHWTSAAPASVHGQRGIGAQGHQGQSDMCHALKMWSTPRLCSQKTWSSVFYRLGCLFPLILPHTSIRLTD